MIFIIGKDVCLQSRAVLYKGQEATEINDLSTMQQVNYPCNSQKSKKGNFFCDNKQVANSNFHITYQIIIHVNKHPFSG